MLDFARTSIYRLVAPRISRSRGEQTMTDDEGALERSVCPPWCAHDHRADLPDDPEQHSSDGLWIPITRLRRAWKDERLELETAATGLLHEQVPGRRAGQWSRPSGVHATCLPRRRPVRQRSRHPSPLYTQRGIAAGQGDRRPHRSPPAPELCHVFVTTRASSTRLSAFPQVSGLRQRRGSRVRKPPIEALRLEPRRASGLRLRRSEALRFPGGR